MSVSDAMAMVQTEIAKSKLDMIRAIDRGQDPDEATRAHNDRTAGLRLELDAMTKAAVDVKSLTPPDPIIVSRDEF